MGSQVGAPDRLLILPEETASVSLAMASALADASAAIARLDQALASHPLRHAFLYRVSVRATATVASANRLSLFLPARTPSWCILHELAHSMTTNLDGQSDGHGSFFMGIYVKLLVRYLRFDQTELFRSLVGEYIQIEPDARATFLGALANSL